MAGNRILCSCWSSGTFQVCNITLPPVVQLELCTLQCKPSTFYNNKEKFNYTFISLFNKTCLGDWREPRSQETTFPVWPTISPPETIWMFPFSCAIYFISSPLLFTLYLLSLLFTSNHPPPSHAIYFTFPHLLFATHFPPLLFT